METNEIYAAFGLEAPVSETVQEVADPVEETAADEGVNEQEVAEPVEESVDEPAVSADEPVKKRVQSAEENAAYAAMRRKAERERDEAVERAKEQARQELNHAEDDLIAEMKLTDPYTGKVINTRAQYEQYKSNFASESVSEKTDTDYDEVTKLINEHPTIKRAEAVLQRFEAQTEAQARERAKERLAADISEISQIDPQVKGLADLQAMESYPEVLNLVRSGVSLVSAFKAVNYDRLVDAARQAGSKQALHKAAGKEHLRATQSKTNENVAVPSDIKAAYRMFNPDASDAEIQAHWNKANKRKD